MNSILAVTISSTITALMTICNNMLWIDMVPTRHLQKQLDVLAPLLTWYISSTVKRTGALAPLFTDWYKCTSVLTWYLRGTFKTARCLGTTVDSLVQNAMHLCIFKRLVINFICTMTPLSSSSHLLESCNNIIMIILN